jgi:hypothetical protein
VGFAGQVATLDRRSVGAALVDGKPLKLASSKEPVRDARFRQFTKCMIQGSFCDVEGAEAVGFSHGQLGLVVEALNDAAGELLFGTEAVQDQRAVRA